MGNIRLILLYFNGKEQDVILLDILYILKVKINLIRTICLGRKGIKINLLLIEVIITHLLTRKILGYGDIVGNQYFLY
jgi:hypothetical protein